MKKLLETDEMSVIRTSKGSNNMNVDLALLLLKKCFGLNHKYCVKSVRFGLHFPALGLNTEHLSLFSPNAGKCGPE